MSGGRISSDDFITSYGGALAGPMIGFEYEIQDDDYDDDVQSEEEYVATTYGVLPPKFDLQYESLGYSHGFEIKSPVANLQTHKRIWGKLTKKFSVAQSDSRHDGGIHVNVSNVNTPYPEAFVRLMYDHQKIFRTASGRDIDSWNEFCCFHYDDDHYDNDNYTFIGEHYHIFNTDKPYAYEFRMFKAEPHLLLPALELADAAVTICRPFGEQGINRVGDPFLTMGTMLKFLSSSTKYSHAYGVMKDAVKETYPSV